MLSNREIPFFFLFAKGEAGLPGQKGNKGEPVRPLNAVGVIESSLRSDFF